MARKLVQERLNAVITKINQLHSYDYLKKLHYVNIGGGKLLK